MPQIIEETNVYEKFRIVKINREGDIEIIKSFPNGQKNKMLIENGDLNDIIEKLKTEIASQFVAPVILETETETA